MNDTVINSYFNTLKHLKLAEPFLIDIELINETLRNFTTERATNLIDKLAKKYRADFTYLGKSLTGIMILKQSELPDKTNSDLVEDLIYQQRCIVISAAVHCGIENTLQSAVNKLKRANETI